MEFADFESTTAVRVISALENKLLAGSNKADQTVCKHVAELVYRATNQSNIGQMLNQIAVYAKRSGEDDDEAIKDVCVNMVLLAVEHTTLDERKADTFIAATMLGHRFNETRL